MIKTSDITCYKFLTKWHACHPSFKNTIGVSSLPEEAIKDFRKQVKRKFRELYMHRFTYGAGEGSQ